MATIAQLLEVKQDDVEWDAWFTDKMSITHLALLEDHLLDYSQRSADDQCKNCMLWHCEKLKGYSIYEAPKFFDGDHESTYQKAGELAQAVQDSLGNLAQSEALDYAKKVRDLRYELIGYGVYDFTVAQGQDRHFEELEAMKLLTKEIRDKLPRLYSQEKVQDPIVQVKFFTPDSNWTWYGIEFDGKDLFFGWVVGLEKEMGYFSLKELESARGPLGLPIERDKWFTPMRLSEVKKLHQQEGLGMAERRTIIKAEMEELGPCKELSRMLQETPLGAESMLAWASRLKYQADRAEGCRSLQKAAYEEAARIKLAVSPVIKPIKMKGAEMEQEKVWFYIFRLEDGVKAFSYSGALDRAVDEIMTKIKTLDEREVRKRISLMETALVAQEQGGPKTIQQLLQEQTLLEQHQKDRPQDIIFFKDTIMKHYYPKEDFHPDSFRVVKPEPGVMVTLGCLKEHKWYPEKLECVPTQTLHRTIVPRTEKYIKEAEEWEAVGVPAQHRETEVGIVPRELAEVISGS